MNRQFLIQLLLKIATYTTSLFWLVLQILGSIKDSLGANDQQWTIKLEPSS